MDTHLLYQTEGEVCDNKIATGKYINNVNTTGWGNLEIETFKGFEPEIQAYAAGVLEGILTELQIRYHYMNTVQGMCKGFKTYCRKLYSYLSKNMDWIHSQVLEKPKTDIYWRQQFASRSPTYSSCNCQEELFDLTKFLQKKPDKEHDDPDPGKCSGLVKVTDGNKDLLMSHVAMSGYNTMNRVLKMYKFSFDEEFVPGHTYSFSGYAGALASADDYTLVSSGLLSIETTISVFNTSLYSDKYIKPEGQLHCWVRSIIANQLARTGKEWTDIFARYNSGTYNNQWTVLDYKLFKPGQELPNNDLLWILEQVPGYTMSRDVTWFLRKYRYWPSYNIPFLNKISRLSMFDVKAQENDWWRWGYCPRARIFHRDHHKVVDLDSLKDLMRYNDYTHDDFSKCTCSPPYTAEAAISTRGDLNDPNGTYALSGMGFRNHGSLDYKGTNYALFQKLRFQAIGGPTYDPLPAFDWRTTKVKANHFGQPDLWNFKPLSLIGKMKLV
uniref:Phospholipase B-like n=1 Tax=Ditylenchus dipsaci TaxID=166011 RepID=A0A915CXR7_9BILA